MRTYGLIIEKEGETRDSVTRVSTTGSGGGGGGGNRDFIFLAFRQLNRTAGNNNKL